MEWYFVQLAFMRLWGRLECAKSRNNGVICVIIISYYIWRMLGMEEIDVNSLFTDR